MRPSKQDGLPEAGIVCACRLSRGGDRTQVVGAFDLGGLWVQRLGKPLEAAGSLLDLLVRVWGHCHRVRI